VAEPFRGFIGYNNQNTGETVDSQFDGPYGLTTPRPAPSPPLVEALVEPIAPKTFLALSGTLSGYHIVQGDNGGLIASSRGVVQVRGKTTVIEPNGRKTSTPINVKIERTSRITEMAGWFNGTNNTRPSGALLNP